MSNFVLKRVDRILVGAVGAAPAACRDIGSTREIVWSTGSEREMATASKYGDAAVEASDGGQTGQARIMYEEITMANLALQTGATQVDGGIQSDGTGGKPDYFTLYAYGYDVDGVASRLHLVKVAAQPSSELALAKSQQVPEITLDMFVDPDATCGYKFWRLAPDPDADDTTAPTVSSTTPAHNATGVARSGSVSIVFDEAVRAEDITDKSILLATAAGTPVAFTAIALSADGLTVTATYSGLGATTAHVLTVVKGIRDVAGNKLAATVGKLFTTGS